MNYDLRAVNERDRQVILSNSIERVINTTMRILEEVLSNGDTAPELVDLADMNLSDWIENKATVVHVWDMIRAELFAKQY